MKEKDFSGVLMKKKLIWLLVPVLLLLGLGIGCFCHRAHWDNTHVILGGTEYPLDLDTLDLSGQSVLYIRELAVLKNLKYLDLRNTGVNPDDLLWLRKQLPECSIQWLVPFQGTYLAEDTREIILSSLSQEDREALSLFPQLKTVDGRACNDPTPLLELKALRPDLEVYYSVELEQQRYDWDTKELNLVGKNLTDLLQTLPLLPRLTSVTFTQPVKDIQGLNTLMDRLKDVAFIYSLHLFGQDISLDVTSLDFTGIPMTDTVLLDAAIPHFSNLEHVEMVDCGLADEVMGALNQRWPDTLFVWEVTLGPHKIRTDITYFMPYQYDYDLTDADADTLKYFTEVICIDFGHMDISRTDYLAYMPKLQYLLMCDTKITDLTPVAGLQELKYAELFLTPITDFSPLIHCPNLVDLNVSYTEPDDYMVFTQMQQLENLWFVRTNRSWVVRDLRSGLPNTKVITDLGSATGFGWRKLPNYYAQRDILGMYYIHED